MKLYRMVSRDRSGQVNWLLHELGVDFETVELSYQAGDLDKEEYLAKHPLGQVPVLEDGSVRLFESNAIVAYLADKYTDSNLAPPISDLSARGEYYKWLFFATNSAADFFSRTFRLEHHTEEYKEQWESYLREKVLRVMSAIEDQLDGREYILGAFSAVDPCLGYALWSVSNEPFFNDFPRTRDYFHRLQSREACQKSKIFEVPG